MSFKIVDQEGNTLHAVEGRRVNKVRVLTKFGESATIGIDPDQTEIQIVFEYANPNEINVVDIDKFKPGYEPNLTGKDVAKREKELEKLRPNENVGQDVFTKESIEEREQAEADARERAEAEEAERNSGPSDSNDEFKLADVASGQG